MKAPREQDMVKPALTLLGLRGCFVWRNNTGAVPIASGNGRRRFVRFSTPGASDILGVLPGGRFLAVELKKPGGRLRASQRSFLEAVRKHGGLALVACSLADLDALLAEALGGKPRGEVGRGDHPHRPSAVQNRTTTKRPAKRPARAEADKRGG